MADVIPHFCTGTGCEALHGGSGEHPEVKIAKINADRDVEVAKIGRQQEQSWNEARVAEAEVEAEAAVAVAAVEGAAAVDEAIVENEILEEIVNPEPAEQVVVVQQESGPEESEEAGTPAETGPPVSESKSKGWWDAYR